MSTFHIQLIAKDGADLRTSFTAVARQLNLTQRLHMELDGSFVWVGDGWQLDGMIYDLDDRIQYVDLKGCCPKTIWETLIGIFLLDPSVGNVVNLPDGGLYDLQTFEKMTWA